MSDPDLVIIGAGPAGLSTALHLIERDPSWTDRLLVIEKRTHPRHKLCGGGVTQLGLDVLKALRIDILGDVPHKRIPEARFIYRNRRVSYRHTPAMVVFYRSEFDDALAREAHRRGIRIRENSAVRSIQITEDGARVSFDGASLRARAVVGADGSLGLTRRLVNPASRARRQARLLEIFSRPPDGGVREADGAHVIFDFTPSDDHLQGYIWDFPVFRQGESLSNYGVYDSRIAARRPRAHLPDLLTAALDGWSAGTGGDRFEGHPIHWFSPNSRLAIPHLLLVGDAAGVDPLLGEGIAPALAYGKIAAKSLDNAFAYGDFSFKNYRREVLFSRLGWILLQRWSLAWWGYRLGRHPAYMHSLWTIATLLSGLASVEESRRLRRG